MDTKTLRKREGLLAVGIGFGIIFSAILLILYMFAVYQYSLSGHEPFLLKGGVLFGLLLMCIFFSLTLYGYSIYFIGKCAFSKENNKRITRLDFILNFVVFLVLGIIVGGVVGGFVGSIFGYSFGGDLLVFHLSWFIFSLKIIIGRLKDCNYSKHFVWLYFIPGVNILFHIFLSLKLGTIGENKYGPDPLEMKDEASVLS